VGDISRAVRENEGQLSGAANFVDDEDLRILKARPVPAGSTVFAKIGEALRLNRRALTTKPLVLDNNCMAASPKLCADPGFLFQYFRTVDLSPFSVATTVPSVRKGDVESVGVGLPPLPEQRRIVAKIDSLSSKSKRAREHLDHIPRLVEKYKQAVLAAVHENASQFAPERVSLGEIASEVRNGLSKKPSENPSGLPILRISAVRPMRVRLDDVRHYPPDEVVSESSLLRNGDLLFTRYNGNPEFTAVCGMVAGLTRKTTYPDKLIRVRLTEGVEPQFVELMSASPQARQWLEMSIKSAAGQHGISGSDLKRMPLPIPHLVEQCRLVTHVTRAFTWIDRLAAEATSARKLIDRLDQAVLAKAFRGELVPQDPDDEPASVLLERIRAERETTPAAKPRRGRARRS